MLVLIRQPDQSIVIDTGVSIITVTVFRVRGDRVRIGIDAPSDVVVRREEKY